MSEYLAIKEIESTLREVAECLQGVPLTDSRARELLLRALVLKREVNEWWGQLPARDRIADMSKQVARLLAEARAARDPQPK